MKDVYHDKLKSAQILLNSVGASNYNVLAGLTAPKASTELECDKLVKVLKNHLAPKTLVPKHYFFINLSNTGQLYFRICDWFMT